MDLSALLVVASLCGPPSSAQRITRVEVALVEVVGTSSAIAGASFSPAPLRHLHIVFRYKTKPLDGWKYDDFHVYEYQVETLMKRRFTPPECVTLG